MNLLPSSTHIVETMIWRFAQDGLHTPSVEITRHDYISIGHLLRAFPTKQALLDAYHAHAVALLAASLQTGAGRARLGELLKEHLEVHPLHAVSDRIPPVMVRLRTWQDSVKAAVHAPC